MGVGVHETGKKRLARRVEGDRRGQSGIACLILRFRSDEDEHAVFRAQRGAANAQDLALLRAAPRGRSQRRGEAGRVADLDRFVICDL